ncbi:hypothetical protein I3760_03G226800 [Carya illinoinensis]|nr:hypothetical protein I3760_03G226800 [Carya illinoinensis]
MLVANYTTWKKLINNGCSANVLFWDAFTIMGIKVDQLCLAPTTLKGFTRETVQPIGSSTLPVSIGVDPHIATIMTNFLVVRTRLAYNAIIGWPTLNTLRAITSKYHLKMKFHMEARIGKVHGEQVLA